MSVAHLPKGPVAPAGRAPTAAERSAGRSERGVAGLQGNGPSSHTVAASRPMLRSSASRTADSRSSSTSRSSARGCP